MVPLTRSPRRRASLGAVTLILGLSLVLAACGGGDGGDGNGANTDFHLTVLVVNKDQTASHALSYSGGAALSTSEDDEDVESCTAAVVQYPLTLPFEVSIDGVVILNSDDQAQLPHDGESNLITNITVAADGTASAVPAEAGDLIEAGNSISRPAALGICNGA